MVVGYFGFFTLNTIGPGILHSIHTAVADFSLGGGLSMSRSLNQVLTKARNAVCGSIFR